MHLSNGQRHTGVNVNELMLNFLHAKENKLYSDRI